MLCHTVLCHTVLCKVFAAAVVRRHFRAALPAAVAFGDETASRTPNLLALFDSHYGDNTVERKALATALKPFGVRVVSWASNNDTVDGALVFPAVSL